MGRERHLATIDANEGVYIGEEGTPDEIIIDWGEFRLTLVKGDANADLNKRGAEWVNPEVTIYAEALVEREGYRSYDLGVSSSSTGSGPSRRRCGFVRLYG